MIRQQQAATQKPVTVVRTMHRGWIIPYLPEPFTVSDYYIKTMMMQEGKAHGYLEGQVRAGRLICVERREDKNHVYARNGWHMRRVLYSMGRLAQMGGD